MHKGQLTMNPKDYIMGFRQQYGRLPSQVEMSKTLGISPQAAIRALMEQAQVHHDTEAPAKEEKPSGGIIVALVVGLLIISVLTFILSVYFTSLWFQTMFSFFISGAISVSMVSYMVLSPQAALFVKGFVKAPLWATFAIALVFSMGSTVAGQYNKLTENVDVEVVNDRAYLELLERQEHDLVSRIEEEVTQQRAYQDSVERLSATEESRIANSGYIRTERNMFNTLAASINGNRERLAEVRAKIEAELLSGTSATVEQRADFFSWMAGIFNVERSMMEFMIAAFPAVFIDIIAALSLNIAISLLQKRKK